jgi:hypothetical protein
MDRGGARPRRLKAASRLTVLTPALLAAAQVGPLPNALRWTASGQAISALTSLPPECLHSPDDPVERAKVEVGRAAFRTPMLLGGQAARLGLTCESCHVNGRTNPAFLFPTLSGAPGTADVTNALLSTHRDNGLIDPRSIPDLAAPGKVSRREDRPDLRDFIRGLVVQEFDGNEPPPAVLDGLTAYVRSLDATSCRTGTPANLTEAWSDTAVRAVAAARARAAAGDRASALLMLAAARSALGRLDESYADIAADHSRLLKADSGLSTIQKMIEHGEQGGDRRMTDWLRGARFWRAALIRDEALSLFNPDMLANRIKGRPG